MAQRWGDVLDDDSDDEDIIQQPSHSSPAGGLVIPPTHKSRIDSKGIQIVTSYRQHPANDSQLLKTITKVKVFTESVKNPRPSKNAASGKSLEWPSRMVPRAPSVPLF